MADDTLAPSHAENTKGATLRDRRRQVLVDPRYQLRAGVMVGLVAFVLLALLDLSLMTGGGVETLQPAARAVRAGGDGASWILLLFGSVVLLGGVVLVGVLESHRTAGAAFAIRRTVLELQEGRHGARVRLRRRDHLQELAAAVNRLAETLDTEREARR